MSIDESGFLSPEIEVYRQKIRQQYAESFDLIERASRCCHASKTKFVVHNLYGQEVCAVGLFLKIIGDVEAATLLLERGLTSQARSLLRVAIEGTIILAKICEQYEFAYVYGIVAEQERLKLIKGIKNDKLTGYENLRREFTDSLIESIEETVAGQPTANLRQWATDVNMAPIYAGPYRLFSADVHSGAASLSKFFIMDEAGVIKTINWGPELVDNCQAELSEAVRLLLTILSLANKLFKVDVDTEADKIWEEYKQLAARVAEQKGTTLKLTDSHPPAPQVSTLDTGLNAKTSS